MASNETINLLARIAAAVEKTAAAAERAASCLERMEKRRAVGGAQASGSAPAVADAADLDSKYGDPEVKRDPPRWSGAAFAPCRMSECSPEYLDCLASFCEWCADKAREERDAKKEAYKRRDAARARGWAMRIRAGWRRPVDESSAEYSERIDDLDAPTGDGGW
jgi:hypothetical protein